MLHIFYNYAMKYAATPTANLQMYTMTGNINIQFE